jgi:hypothetical protein
VSDIETVRKAALLLEAENHKLVREVTKLRRELHELKGGDPEQFGMTCPGDGASLRSCTEVGDVEKEDRR